MNSPATKQFSEAISTIIFKIKTTTNRLRATSSPLQFFVVKVNNNNTFFGHISTYPSTTIQSLCKPILIQPNMPLCWDIKVSNRLSVGAINEIGSLPSANLKIRHVLSYLRSIINWFAHHHHNHTMSPENWNYAMLQFFKIDRAK